MNNASNKIGQLDSTLLNLSQNYYTTSSSLSKIFTSFITMSNWLTNVSL